jgi:hypothetical protein
MGAGEDLGGARRIDVGCGGMVRGRLVQHRVDDALEALRAQTEALGEGEILSVGAVVVVVRVPAPPGLEVEDVLAVGESVLVLVVALGSASVGVGGRGGPAGGVGHAELSAGLGEAGAGMDPEQMVDDEGPGALLARRDGVEMVRMLVGGGAEGGRGVRRAGDVPRVERRAHVANARHSPAGFSLPPPCEQSDDDGAGPHRR